VAIVAVRLVHRTNRERAGTALDDQNSGGGAGVASDVTCGT